MEGLKLIVIVDYKMGNLPNVKRAVELFTKDVIISSDVEEIKKAEKILLPGVGAFGDAIRNIEELGLREAIVEASKTKPFM
jgi:imidazole glycerol-phosphate synthase subunit HisH